ncbi:TetR/AcrR family transcriptional regulator [Nitriliruptoraceae bacterium ZYF776]|nr:TetR/AcrR family transcriptional regulator [Profundirhabdus halotolerans]
MPVPTPTLPRWMLVPDPTRRRADTRRRILDAAIELLTEAGYQRLTVEGIAARAGVGKQTIYRWWPTKGAVVLDAFLDRAENAEADEPGLPATGDLATDLRVLLRATVAEFSDVAFEAPYRALVVAMQDDPDLAEQVTDRITRASGDVVRDWLRDARAAEGLDAEVDVDVVLDVMFGPIMRRWLLRTDPLDEAFADGLADAVLRVLGVSGR